MRLLKWLLCLCVQLASWWTPALAKDIIIINEGLNDTATMTMMPRNITLRVAVTADPPMAMTAEDGVSLKGYQLDLLLSLQQIAFRDDGVRLNLEIDNIRNQYSKVRSFDLVASNCREAPAMVEANRTEDCGLYQLLLAPLLSSPKRYVLADLTPPFQQEYTGAVRYELAPQPHYNTFTEVDRANGTVCISRTSLIARNLLKRYPNLNIYHCVGFLGCLKPLKAGLCNLAAGFINKLRYAALQDPTLVLTNEAVNKNYQVWSMPYSLDSEVRSLVKKWMYTSVVEGVTDQLYKKYYESKICPLGWAGQNCTQPCHSEHGRSDATGKCICDSTRYTGDDCATEVVPQTGLIPQYQLVLGYCMFVSNVILVLGCAAWLFQHRVSRSVQVAQPFFLFLVLLGCLISSSTILALMQQAGPGKSHNYCMLIPWLYSIGFSVTFGTLFTKIYRIHKVVKNAMRMRRVKVTVLSAVQWIAVVLCVDMSVLIAWQVEDPLEWVRTETSSDKFGFVLASVGTCYSQHWAWFAGIIGVIHFLLVVKASYMCITARKMPNHLSGVRGVSIAMISNFQIFLVVIPMLFLVGTDPKSSFFLRSAVVWLNDMAVVLAIFGDLMFGKWAADSQRNTVKVSGFSSHNDPTRPGFATGSHGGEISESRNNDYRNDESTTHHYDTSGTSFTRESSDPDLTPYPP